WSRHPWAHRDLIPGRADPWPSRRADEAAQPAQRNTLEAAPSSRSCVAASLPLARRAREPPRFLGGAEQGLGLVDALLLFARRVRIGDDAGAGLDVHFAVLD